MCACVRACVRVCVRACACVCVGSPFTIKLQTNTRFDFADFSLVFEMINMYLVHNEYICYVYIICSAYDQIMRTWSGSLVKSFYQYNIMVIVLRQLYVSMDHVVVGFLYCCVMVFFSITWSSVLPPTPTRRALFSKRVHLATSVPSSPLI